MNTSTRRELIDTLIDGLSFKYHSGNYDNDNPPHRHEGRLFPFTVIVCVTRGEYIGEIDQQVWVARPHTALIVPPGIIHTIEVKKRCLNQYAHLFFWAFQSIDLLSLFHVPAIIGGKSGVSLEKLVRALSRFFKTVDDTEVGLTDLVMAKRIGFQILEIIISRSKLKEESYDFLLGLQKIKPAIDHINSHTHEAIAPDTLAALLNMSQNKFKKIFSAIMRKTPLQYIRQVRIQKAQGLLSSGDLSIKEISCRTGYKTIFYFSRDFKNVTGKSPLDYRRTCRLAVLGKPRVR